MEQAHLELIVRGAERIGLALTPEQLRLLGRHIDLLLKWNRSINLTSITQPEEVVEKHVLDSLAMVPLVPAGSLLDVGSGGGFPGIPAAIVRPELDVLLVDSVQKKVAFLKNALAELRLPNARARAVRLAGEPSMEEVPRFHAAVARAFAAPLAWLKLAECYVLPGGVALCMLGPAEELPARVGDLHLVQEMKYQLPFSGSERRLAVYQHR